MPPRHRLRRLGQLSNTLTCPWKPGGGAMHWQGVCTARPPPAITPLAGVVRCIGQYTRRVLLSTQSSARDRVLGGGHWRRPGACS